LIACRSETDGLMSNFNEERVLSVHHWTDRLFSFRTTRAPTFRYRNGQFTMIGLKVEGKPLLRAYSMASANHDDHLEFFSIKVADGPLTSRLQHLKDGDPVIVGQKPTGTLVLDNLLPGKNLYLLGTGTGLAPFLSVIRDLEAYERFEKIVLVHGCRFIKELAYGDLISDTLPADEHFGALVNEKLIYYPTVTREPYKNNGRISLLLENGKLCDDIGLPHLNKDTDRVMLCGSPHMLADLRTILEARGFDEGNMGEPGHFVIEKAFVEK
jgi:ferredoxin--NADP+ reductase